MMDDPLIQQQPPSDDEAGLHDLRTENLLLNEQVKLLTKTEHRLQRSQAALDREFARARVLSEFSLSPGVLERPKDVIARALGCVRSSFRVAAPVALHFDATGSQARNLEGESEEFCPVPPQFQAWLHDAKRPVMMTSPSRPPGFEQIFSLLPGFPREEAPERIVIVPIRNGDRRLIAALVAWASSDRSFHLESPQDQHLPFFELLATHLERALHTAQLVSDLKDRTKQLEEVNQSLSNSLEKLAQTHAQLIQAGKLEAIGQLAGGIAHDFNNLLGVITTRAHLLKETEGLGAESVEDVQYIIEAAERATGITKQLLAFGRRSAGRPECFELNALVTSMAKMLTHLIGETYTLDLRLDPNVRSIVADKSQIEQVAMNLVINARDAMREGGVITIETRRPTEADVTASDPVIDPGTHCVLEVRDTGVGMDATTREQIFQPFFSTKGVGKGSGLGLSVVYGAAKQARGQIFVKSDIGKGSIFTLLFPETANSTKAAAGSAGPTEVHRWGGTSVLLVEDEEGLRASARLIMARAGFQVLEARHGEEAMEVAAKNKGTIDLLVTDVVMPKMGGVKLASELRRLRPNVRVLFMSGYAFELLSAEDPAHPHDQFLQKPFTPKVLLESVRKALTPSVVRQVVR